MYAYDCIYIYMPLYTYPYIYQEIQMLASPIPFFILSSLKQQTHQMRNNSECLGHAWLLYMILSNRVSAGERNNSEAVHIFFMQLSVLPLRVQPAAKLGGGGRTCHCPYTCGSQWAQVIQRESNYRVSKQISKLEKGRKEGRA